MEITATVKAEGGQTVFQTREDHDSSELAGSAGGYGFQARIPLKGFAPGPVRAARRGDRRRSAIAPTVGERNRVSSGGAAAGSAMKMLLSTDSGDRHAGRRAVARCTVVSRETMSMVDEPKQAVARTAAEWAALWRQHAGDTAAAGGGFRIAHGRRGVSRHRESSAGFAVDITGAREAGGALIVEWQERRPAARRGVRAGADQPRA